MVQMIRFFLICALFFGLGKQTESVTDGFAMNKIAHLLVQGEDPPFDESPLAQRYTYLAKGGQSYVFASEDGKYVLKCFRGSRLHNLEFFSPFSEKMAKKCSALKGDLHQTFYSYHIAHVSLGMETGVLGVHFSHTPLQVSRVKIIDPVGIEHMLDLQATPFILQQRGIPLKEGLTSLIEKGETAKAKTLIENTFAVIQKCAEKGIGDRDPNLGKNFGIVEGRAIEIDGGGFSPNSSLAMGKLASSTEELCNYLSPISPELSLHLKKVYVGFANAMD